MNFNEWEEENMAETKFNDLQLVSINDAAGILGISHSTLAQWLCYERFPYIKVGRRTMIAIRDIRDFISRNRVEVSGD